MLWHPVSVWEGTTKERIPYHLPENSITIGRSIHRSNARGRIALPRVRHVNADALVRVAARLRLAHDDLLDIAVLPKVLGATQRLQELVLVAYRRIEADDINEVLLDHPHTGQVFATGGLDLALLGFLLLRGGGLSVFQRQVCLESRLEGLRVSAKNGGPARRFPEHHVLIGIGHLVLDGTFIIGASAVRTPAFFAVGFDIVVAKLANLQSPRQNSPNRVRVGFEG